MTLSKFGYTVQPHPGFVTRSDSSMSEVYFLRPGRGPGRIACRDMAVDLSMLEARTRERTLWFVSEDEIPEIGRGRASTDAPPRFVVVRVEAEETTLRFDSAGFWLFRSLTPREYDGLSERGRALLHDGG